MLWFAKPGSPKGWISQTRLQAPGRLHNTWSTTGQKSWKVCCNQLLLLQCIWHCCNWGCKLQELLKEKWSWISSQRIQTTEKTLWSLKFFRSVEDAKIEPGVTTISIPIPNVALTVRTYLQWKSGTLLMKIVQINWNKHKHCLPLTILPRLVVCQA